MTDGLPSGEVLPGEVLPAEGTVTLNEGRETTEVTVRNTGDRPVQVGSHFHFFEVNAALAFDRAAAFGSRLNVPAGTAVRFEPGETQTVELVAIGGKRRVEGANGLTDGSVDGGREAALERARAAGFADDGAAAAEAAGHEDGGDAAEADGDEDGADAPDGDEPAESTREDEDA